MKRKNSIIESERERESEHYLLASFHRSLEQRNQKENLCHPPYFSVYIFFWQAFKIFSERNGFFIEGDFVYRSPRVFFYTSVHRRPCYTQFNVPQEFLNFSQFPYTTIYEPQFSDTCYNSFYRGFTIVKEDFSFSCK